MSKFTEINKEIREKVFKELGEDGVEASFFLANEVRDTLLEAIDEIKNGMIKNLTPVFGEKKTSMMVQSVATYSISNAFVREIYRNSKSGEEFEMFDDCVGYMRSMLSDQLEKVKSELN